MYVEKSLAFLCALGPAYSDSYLDGGYQAYIAMWYQQYLKSAQNGNGVAGGAGGAPPQPPSGGQ
jgi:hypothetical protein